MARRQAEMEAERAEAAGVLPCADAGACLPRPSQLSAGPDL